MELQDCVNLARTAARVQRKIVQLTEQMASEVASEGHRHTLPGDIDHLRAALADVEERLPDTTLLRTYQLTDGVPDNADANDLLAEINRRELDT